MANVTLTSNFFKNARGLTISDGGGVTWSFNKNTNTLSAAGSSGGVLSSVGLADTSTMPIYTITNSPLTNNGTLDITLKTQSANLVFAGPTTGAATQPTFRAMVVADLPMGIPNANLQNSSLTVTAGTGLSGGGAVSLGGAVTLSLTSPVTAILGGTGQTVYAVGDLLYASTTTALSRLADVAAGSYLRSGGVSTAPVWSAITIPNAATLGDIWYSDVANDIAALAGNTTATKKFLTQTGTGSVSAAPAWGTIAAGDLPANGANPTAKVALAAVNGSATTWMRSDGAPALDVTISPTWTGNHTFSPTAGRAGQFNGVSGQQTVNITGNSANGNSYGLEIIAGTTSGDWPLAILNAATTAVFAQIFGDGHGTLGASSTLGLQWATTGTFNFSNGFLGNTANSNLGYAAGSGGAVTQLTSRTTGVTLNKITGAITLFAAAGTAAFTTFTVTNSTVAATDTIILSVKSGTNVYLVHVTAVAAGSFNITFNTTGGTSSDSPVINFAVIKAAAS